jgi:hypothetical protein
MELKDIANGGFDVIGVQTIASMYDTTGSTAKQSQWAYRNVERLVKDLMEKCPWVMLTERIALTPNSDTATITGATQADPVVITATSHGFSNGDRVKITDVVGMTELNDRYFIVANVTADTFELYDEDGSTHTAYSSAGTATKQLANHKWTYQFSKPSDCIKPLSCYGLTGDEWEQSGQYLYSNEPTLLLTYIKTSLDPDDWPSDFQDLCMARIAAEAALPLRGQKAIIELAWEAYRIKLAEVQGNNGVEAGNDMDAEDEWCEERWV